MLSHSDALHLESTIYRVMDDKLIHKVNGWVAVKCEQTALER